MVAKSNSSDNPNRVKTKSHLRSKSTIMRLNMYKNGNPIRNKGGKIIGGTLLMSNKSGGVEMPKVARIAPNRQWFGNTRTISTLDIDKYRADLLEKKSDPLTVIMKQEKLPQNLFKEQNLKSVDGSDVMNVDTVSLSTYKRKKPKYAEQFSDLENFHKQIQNRYNESNSFENTDDYLNRNNTEAEVSKRVPGSEIMAKGQSKRIWGELYKVLDCSDVVLEIIDARDVPGTRCYHVENHIKTNALHKQLVLVLNKCDLVPSWITKKWVKLLSQSFPTVAFHSSITNSFGKGALISLLRQFGQLHSVSVF